MNGDKGRILRIREFLREKELDAALIFSPSNRRYMCGFTGSTGYVVITETKCCFLVDFRYQEQAIKECPEIHGNQIPSPYTPFPGNAVRQRSNLTKAAKQLIEL